jgi:dTDP-4-dehydrorhamnose 3,5-epimerase
MIFIETKLKGAFIIDMEKLEDKCNFFARAWRQRELEAHGLYGNEPPMSVELVFQPSVLLDPAR